MLFVHLVLAQHLSNPVTTRFESLYFPPCTTAATRSLHPSFSFNVGGIYAPQGLLVLVRRYVSPIAELTDSLCRSTMTDRPGTQGRPPPLFRTSLPLPRSESFVRTSSVAPEPGMFTFGRRTPRYTQSLPADAFTKSGDISWGSPKLSAADNCKGIHSMRESQDKPSKRRLVSTFLKDKRQLFEETLAQPTSATTRSHLYALYSGYKIALEHNAAKLLNFSALPIEIQQYIFDLIVHARDNATNPVLQRTYLTHVCQRWREMAISYQSLWDWICPTDTRPWERTMEWLGRLGGAKFHLHVIQCWKRRDGSVRMLKDDEMLEFLTMVSSKYDQIYEVNFTINSLVSAYTVLQPFSIRPAPRALQIFRVVQLNKRPWPNDPTPVKNTLGALSLFNGVMPKLRIFGLDCVTIDWSNFVPKVLKILQIHRIPPSHCPDSLTFRRLLLASPRLTALLLQDSGPNLSMPCNEPPVSLPNLRVLTFSNPYIPTATAILSYFTAPNLAVLDLGNTGSDDSGPLISSITGWYPKLEVLTFNWFSIADTPQNRLHLARFFKALPNLVLLKVLFGHALLALVVLIEDLNKLHEQGVLSDKERDARVVLCPKLKALFYHDLPIDVVLIFLKCRMLAGVPIEVVYVGHMEGRRWTEKDLAAIEATGTSVCHLNTVTTFEEEERVNKFLSA